MSTIPRESEEVLEAETAFDLFGDTDEAQARRRYYDLARVLHPDHGGDTAAFQKLQALWDRAQIEFSQGTYGTPDAAVHGLKISSRAHTYTLDRRLANGELADVFTATDETGTRCGVKLVRRPANNSLLAHEMEVIREVRDKVEPAFLPYFLEPRDWFAAKEGGVIRRANVFGLLKGFHTLGTVRVAYPDFIDPRDGAWIWRRLLTALGALHQAGVVHGGVLPQHAMILGEQRGMTLVGWCAAQRIGEPITLVSETDRWRYPPEVFDKTGAVPETDIYMAARLIEDLVGPRLPKAFRTHLSACGLPKASMRPGDAWALKDSFDQLNERLFGARKFKPFHMPAIKGEE